MKLPPYGHNMTVEKKLRGILVIHSIYNINKRSDSERGIVHA